MVSDLLFAFVVGLVSALLFGIIAYAARLLGPGALAAGRLLRPFDRRDDTPEPDEAPPPAAPSVVFSRPDARSRTNPDPPPAFTRPDLGHGPNRGSPSASRPQPGPHSAMTLRSTLGPPMPDDPERRRLAPRRQCPKCRAPNDEVARFCRQCGSPLRT